MRLEELCLRGAPLRRKRFGFVTEGKFPILGRPVVETLLQWSTNAGVIIAGWITATKLLKIDGRVAGCVGVTSRGKTILLKAKAVVLCTGGASALFQYHDNPFTNIGDGYAMAVECGATMQDMELTQFYPLLIHAKGMPAVLSPPGLAEKGRVVNDIGEDLREKYGLADVKAVAVKARDKLSAAVYTEIMDGRKVFL